MTTHRPVALGLRGTILRGCLPLLMVILTCGMARADGIPGLIQGPVIHFDTRKVDLGRVSQKSETRYSYHFRNDGNAPLRILKVETECGCTAFTMKDSTLTPGQSSELNIRFDSGNFEGDLTKVVTVTTNDPAEPRVDLVFYINVTPMIKVEPRTIDFGHVHRGETPMLTCRLTAQKGVDFNVLGAKGGEEVLTWKVVPDPQAEGESFLLEGTMRPDAVFGHFFDRVEISLKHPSTNSERIFIKGDVYSYFLPDPGRIVFGTVAQGDSRTASIPFTVDGTKPYKILDVSSPVPYLKPKIEKDGKGYTLKVTIEAPKRELHVREDMVVKTDDPAQPEIKVEVTAVIPK